MITDPAILKDPQRLKEAINNRPPMTHWVYALIVIALGWLGGFVGNFIGLPALLLSSYPERRRIGRAYGVIMAVFFLSLALLALVSYHNNPNRGLGITEIVLFLPLAAVFGGAVALSKWKKP